MIISIPSFQLSEKIIPNGLDTKQYKPIQKAVARSILGLPEDKQLILFGAMSATSDPRKGFNLLQSALQKLSQSGWREQVELVVFGSSQPKNPTELGFKSHYLGRLNNTLAKLRGLNGCRSIVNTTKRGKLGKNLG